MTMFPLAMLTLAMRGETVGVIVEGVFVVTTRVTTPSLAYPASSVAVYPNVTAPKKFAAGVKDMLVLLTIFAVPLGLGAVTAVTVKILGTPGVSTVSFVSTESMLVVLETTTYESGFAVTGVPISRSADRARYML